MAGGNFGEGTHVVYRRLGSGGNRGGGNKGQKRKDKSALVSTIISSFGKKREKEKSGRL